MVVKPSAALRNEYLQVSHDGHADGGHMTIEAYEEREKMLAHRASILAAEAERLAGAPTHPVDDVRARLKEKFRLA